MDQTGPLLWGISVIAIVVIFGISLARLIVLRRREPSDEGSATKLGFRMISGALVFALTVLLFASVTDSWMDQETMYRVDIHIQALFSELEAPLVVAVMQVLTWFGGGHALIAAGVILAIYFLRYRDWRQVVNLFVIFVIGSGVLWLLKEIFGRERPGEALAPTAGHAFPSGHSFWAVVIYGFLIYLTWTETRSRPFQIGMTVALSALILAIASSRVILGAHWVSDVIGGMMFGLAWIVSSLIVSGAAHAMLRSEPVSLIPED